MFGDNLVRFRKENNMSQELLAEMLDVTRQSVAKWESGRSYPEADKLIKLGSVFKVSIDKLLKSIEDDCDVDNISINNETSDDIIDFICKAKRETYAGYGKESKPSRPKGHDFIYEEDKFKYIDSYVGDGARFCGEEVVYSDGNLYWSMNYSGRVIDTDFDGSFLKEALRNVTKEYPYRGPLVYEKGDYLYHCTVTGDFTWFNGYEEIFFNGGKIYELIFNGQTL